MTESVQAMLKAWDERFKEVRARDQEAKKQGALLGRYLREQIADGYAFYEVKKINQRTARIRWISGMGDDYKVPYWGEEATIPLRYIKENIRQRDALEKIFSKRKEA